MLITFVCFISCNTLIKSIIIYLALDNYDQYTIFYKFRRYRQLAVVYHTILARSLEVAG